MPSLCYFDLLAPELIQFIFICCIDLRDGYFVEFNADTPPMVLLRVCKRWHYIAFQTPELFDSISLRRRVRSPNGFDFNRDSWILRTFLDIPRSRYTLRPLAMQLCYGSFGEYGNYLMWSDLLRMVRIIIETTDNLQRLYLRLPDDCMEKLLTKACRDAGNPIRHAGLRSLTLHSTREDFLIRRYLAWWYDQQTNHMPAYYHKLDTSYLPSLEELGLHFRGPLTLDPICYTVHRLHVSIFKWEQLEQYLESCPNVRNLIIELREPLLEQDWNGDELDPAVRFNKIRRLEIRSALKGIACSNKLVKLFENLRLPNLKTLRLRRLPQSDRDVPPYLCYCGIILSNLTKLEELEFIDFLPEGENGANIGVLFANARKLKRLAFREEEIHCSPQYITQFISELTFSGTELRAPCLEVLELDSIHLRSGEEPVIEDLLQLIASRRYPSFYANTASRRRHNVQQALPCLIRKVLLPPGCSEVVRRMDVFDACKDVELDCVPSLENLELETDLDDEGLPRDPIGVWEPIQWRRTDNSEDLVDDHASGSTQPDSMRRSVSASSTLQPMDSVAEVEQMLIPSSYEGGTSDTARNSSYKSFGLSRLDSLAEVELML